MNEIICADCLEVLKSMPDKSVDLVLTDPPYGIGIGRNGQVGGGSVRGTVHGIGDASWDANRIDAEYLQECLRVGVNCIVFGGNYYADLLPASRCWVVWYKHEGLPDRTFADAELAWTSFDANTVVCSVRWDGFIRDSKEAKTIHPTQKPLEVMRWILSRFSNEGDTILDPFCGSGTTCVAAKILGRKYIGIEISPVYAEIARKRVEQAQYEERLFAVTV
jgi:site-specific DNA-methyltransferase (adenine-specific)